MQGRSKVPKDGGQVERGGGGGACHTEEDPSGRCRAEGEGPSPWPEPGSLTHADLDREGASRHSSSQTSVLKIIQRHNWFPGANYYY